MKRLTIVLMLLFIPACGGTPEKAPNPAPASAPSVKPPDEPAALDMLRAINSAQAEYMKRHRRYALTYEELIDARLIKEEPSKDAIGYEIKLRPAPDAGSYRIVAEPVSPTPPARHFFTDKTGVIRAEQGKEATGSSPEV